MRVNESIDNNGDVAARRDDLPHISEREWVCISGKDHCKPLERSSVTYGMVR